MDKPEADYLRRQIQELRQSKARWQALAIISLSVLALLILAGGATLLTGGLLMTQRMREEAMRARDAEMEAREQAEQARRQAEQARDAEMEARMRAEDAARQARDREKGARLASVRPRASTGGGEGKKRLPFPRTARSYWPSSSRTACARACGEKGFGRKPVPGSDSRCGSRASSGYPEMKRAFRPGRDGRRRSTSWGPLIPGSRTSLTSRWIGPA